VRYKGVCECGCCECMFFFVYMGGGRGGGGGGGGGGLLLPMTFPCAVVQSNFLASSQTFEKRLLASSCLSVCPSVRTQQLGSHWTDFRDICYSSKYRESVDKIQQTNIQLCSYISWSSQNEKCFRQTL